MESLVHLAAPGAVIAVRVTPKARREDLVRNGDTLRAWVREPPEDGRANAAVLALLASALGIPRSRLALIRGHTSREKLFRVLD